MGADIDTIAKNFADHYCQTFDNQREGLAKYYREQSMLHFEGEARLGRESIMEKLTNSFLKTQHRISTFDAQPTNIVPGAVLILVNGEVLIDDEPRALQFTQTFHLIPDDKSYWLLNDIFRLTYS
ncbi:nuclear transport factor 2 family protein [Streptomyces virginiae]|uniref:nuclear transport factor 2 family protein n=1 Tax=Streptomyces virginiae TaxID=1961 RepID=UPI0033A74027